MNKVTTYVRTFLFYEACWGSTTPFVSSFSAFPSRRMNEFLIGGLPPTVVWIRCHRYIYLYSLCRYSPYHTKSYHAIPNHIVNEVMSARCCISKYHGCKDATGFGLPLGPPWKSTWIRGWSWIRCGRWCSILWGLLEFQCFHIVGNLQKHGVFGNYHAII